MRRNTSHIYGLPASLQNQCYLRLSGLCPTEKTYHSDSCDTVGCATSQPAFPLALSILQYLIYRAAELESNSLLGWKEEKKKNFLEGSTIKLYINVIWRLNFPISEPGTVNSQIFRLCWFLALSK